MIPFSVLNLSKQARENEREKLLISVRFNGPLLLSRTLANSILSTPDVVSLSSESSNVHGKSVAFNLL